MSSVRSWSPERIAATTAWTVECAQGWLDSVNGIPAAHKVPVPDDHYSDLGLTDPAARYSFGYRFGQRSVAASRPSCGYEDATPESLETEAQFWLGVAAKYDNSHFPASEADWTYEDNYPVDRLLELMTDDEGGWLQWFANECRWSMDDGREGYADLLLDGIHEPVFLVDLGDGRVDVLDGWHRVAASILKGDRGLRAVVEVRKQERKRKPIPTFPGFAVGADIAWIRSARRKPRSKCRCGCLACCWISGSAVQAWTSAHTRRVRALQRNGSS